jgi:hypothetical protein
VSLADGNRASVGDVIITHTNDRRLRLTATDWVKNGDRWTITGIGRNGDLKVRHNWTGAFQSPHPPTQGRFLGFPVFRKRSMIIPFGANIWRSGPN